MSNDCLFRLRVISPEKESFEKLLKIMKAREPDKHLYRIKGIQFLSEHKNKNLYVWEFDGNVAWSDYYWFHDCDPDGEPANTDDVGLVSFLELCKELDIGVESWTEEIGMRFQSHVVCSKTGKVVLEDTKDYEIDDNGDPSEDYPGFGDMFGAWMKPEFVYNGYDSLWETT